jgi:predicted PilT family ATPase
MRETLLKTVKIRGVEIDVYIDNFTGHFLCNIAGEKDLGDENQNVVEARSLQELEVKADEEIKKKQKTSKVKIDVWKWQEEREEGHYWEKNRKKIPSHLVHGTITGIHRKNNHLLISWDGQKGGEQISSYSCGHILILDTEVRRKEYTDLQKQKEAIEAAIEAIEKKHSISYDVTKEKITGKKKEAKIRL